MGTGQKNFKEKKQLGKIHLIITLPKEWSKPLNTSPEEFLLYIASLTQRIWGESGSGDGQGGLAPLPFMGSQRVGLD